MVNSVNEDKAIELRKKMLKNKMPKVQYTEWQITNRMNSLKLSRTYVDDPGLMNLVKKFRDNLQFHRIND